MSSVTRRFGGLAAVSASLLCALVSACGPARPAYFQPQTNAYNRSFVSAPSVLTASADSLPIASAAPTQQAPVNPEISRPLVAASVVTPDRASTPVSRPALHRNPESQSKRQIRRLLDLLPIDHVPMRSAQIDRQSPGRKTHRLGLVALGLSALAYVPLLLAGGGTLVWTLGLTLPLAAVLLGVASLTIIHRNKERYRGKGWAMAAIIIGTGAIGLALVAVAALSVSKVVWEK